MESAYLKNIPKLYFISAFRWFLLIMPVIVLFFRENGLTMSEILTLQAVMSITIILFEVPSGYLSDRFGRKNSLIAGTILSSLAFTIYSFSTGFYGFFAAEIVMGISTGFISGTDSALLFDSLLISGESGSYKKMEGRLASIASFSEGFAGILGGFLAVISLRTPLYIETAITFLAIPVAFSIKEPATDLIDRKKANFKEILLIVKYSLHDNIKIKWLILYSALLGAATFHVVWFIQPYFKEVGLPLVLFGAAWAVLQFSVGFFSLSAHSIEAFVGKTGAVFSLIFLASAAYFLVGFISSVWAISFIFIFYFVRGLTVPLFKDYINKLISSDIRATVLSVRSMILRLIFSILGPFAGWLNDIYSLSVALVTSGAIFLILGVISLYYMHKHRVLTTIETCHEKNCKKC